MALIDEIEIESVWTPSSVRGANTAGTPILSASLTGSGEEISDEYTLTISDRSGGTGTVTVTAGSNNPYDGRVVTSVPMDDSTEVTDVIPGVTIVFDNAAANGNTASIDVGDYKGTFDASGIDAGTPTDGVRHRVTNNGASSVQDAQALLLNQVVMVKKTGSVFSYVKPFAENATEKVSGVRTMPYSITVDNQAGSGGGRTVDLLIDGSPFGADSILDLTTGTTSNSTGLKSTSASYPYAVVDGPLEGLVFDITETCVDGDKANILIFPSRYVQIAEDVAGVEGTYGTDPVDLTTVGQSTGVITAAGVAYFWVRLLVPASAISESNPYPCNVALRASESSDAGWLA